MRRPRTVRRPLCSSGVAGASKKIFSPREASSKSTIHVMDMLICLAKYPYGECHRVADQRMTRAPWDAHAVPYVRHAWPPTG